MKYLVTWMGVTSGSYLGRSDGYPEVKMALIDPPDLDQYEGKEDLKVFRLLEVQHVDDLIFSAKHGKEQRRQEAISLREGALAKLSPEEKKALGHG